MDALAQANPLNGTCIAKLPDISTKQTNHLKEISPYEIREIWIPNWRIRFRSRNLN